MIPRELLAVADVPGVGGQLRLVRHDGDFALFVGRTELMSSRVHGSEEVLAEAALGRFATAAQPQVLVGGLGMGYTLARALALLGPGAVVLVAELVPEVVLWQRQWLGALCGHPLDDARVRVFEGDVGAQIRGNRARFDAILLDVDNGPAGLTRPGNDGLYGRAGLAAAFRALRAGGVLSVWSSAADAAFERRLQASGFRVEVVRVRARRTRGPQRTIWVATVPTCPT